MSLQEGNLDTKTKTHKEVSGAWAQRPAWCIYKECQQIPEAEERHRAGYLSAQKEFTLNILLLDYERISVCLSYPVGRTFYSSPRRLIQLDDQHAYRLPLSGIHSLPLLVLCQSQVVFCLRSTWWLQLQPSCLYSSQCEVEKKGKGLLSSFKNPSRSDTGHFSLART